MITSLLPPILLLFTLQSGQQETPVGLIGEDVATELAKINVTLKDLQDLLVQQLETQALDLLLKRAQLASAEIARLDTLLRGSERGRGHAEDYLVNLDTRIEELQGGSEEMEDEARERQFRHLRREREGALRRLRHSEAEIVELETRMTRQQEHLEGWQQMLDKRLGGSLVHFL